MLNCFPLSGPLVNYDDNNRATLIGIASWGKGCGQIGAPGIFAKVDHVLNWIHATIDEFTDKGEIQESEDKTKISEILKR